ncbi:MAG: hypothetical protein K0R07_69, partial [Sedimentibacter sp.]|nr:hypothetical protein [Sedimentibacter sp.]
MWGIAGLSIIFNIIFEITKFIAYVL